MYYSDVCIQVIGNITYVELEIAYLFHDWIKNDS